VASKEEERAAFRRRLGVTLARVRTRLTSYSQESIAEVLGVDSETVGRWERGIREPKVYDLAQLSEKYNAPAEWLLFPTDSVTELDRRIVQLRLAAAEAARADAGEAPARPSSGGTGVRRGRSQA